MKHSWLFLFWIVTWTQPTTYYQSYTRTKYNIYNGTSESKTGKRLVHGQKEWNWRVFSDPLRANRFIACAEKQGSFDFKTYESTGSLGDFLDDTAYGWMSQSGWLSVDRPHGAVMPGMFNREGMTWPQYRTLHVDHHKPNVCHIEDTDDAL